LNATHLLENDGKKWLVNNFQPILNDDTTFFLQLWQIHMITSMLW